MTDLADPSAPARAGVVEFPYAERAFQALDDAITTMKAAGFSMGSGCMPYPTCCMFGDYMIAKWCNLTPEQRSASHAVMEGDRRNGPLRIRLTNNCPAEGRERFAAILRAKAGDA